MRSWLKSKFTKTRTELEAPNLQLDPADGHCGSNMMATDSAPPSIVIMSESSEAPTETYRSTTGVGNTRNDALNHDAISTTASVPCNDTHSIVETEYEAPDIRTNETGGFFRNAHNTILNNPSMVDNSTNIVMQGADDKRKAKELLLKDIIPGASHDSSARDPPPQCHPGTRIKINERILAWFYDEIKQELILWISGPAGVGKSAIVQTFAEALALDKCLGASVFFSRPNGRNNSDSVLITIAYELALRIEEYSAYIGEKLAFDPRLMNASMKEQFRAFIVEPFVENKVGVGGKAWGIILDGLDELDNRGRQREIIQLITTFVRDHPNVPLVWIISSRPEPHITNTFKQRRLSYKFKEEYVPIDSPEACQDVERFLRSSFKDIQQVEFPHIVAKGWPEETKIVKLANAASGLFAFADVAIRFIRDPDFADPTSRLDEVISMVDGCRAASTDDQPFAHLDALYTHILTRIPSRMWPTTQRVLGAVAVSMLGQYILGVKGLSVILDLPLNKVYAAINDLYALLDIPSLFEVYAKQFRFYHASFADFLRDPARSKKFHTSQENAVIDVNESCLRLWFDFKGPGPRYRDRWSEYVSQFHSEGHQPADVLSKFNSDLLKMIFRCVLTSLEDRWNIVQREGLKHHWDKLLDLLCQIDAGTAYRGDWSQDSFVDLWFDIWKAHREELTSRKFARKIQLQDLRLDSLEHEERRTVICILISGECTGLHFGTQFTQDECTLYLKYFQNCYPELPVLICGPSGSRFGVFKFETIEDDCTNMPPGKITDDIRDSINQHDPLTMYHIFPYSDDA